MKADVINYHDQSLILKFTRDCFFIPLVKRIPVAVKPNVLTLLGFLAVLLFGYFTILATPSFTLGYLFAAMALLVYLIADNIDGMHARNTNQTSSLGGFLDQWLDGISFLIITMSLCSLMRFSHTGFLVILFLMALVNLILYLDQHQSGSFYKPAFGPNELLGSIILLYLLIFLFHQQIIYLYHLTGMKNTNIIVYITVVLSVAYILQALTKVRINRGQIAAAVFFHGITLVPLLTNRFFTPELIGVLIIAVNSIFIGKMLCTIYALPNPGQSFASYLMLSVPKLKTSIAHPKKDAPPEEIAD